jgi:hypothetical protein
MSTCALALVLVGKRQRVNRLDEMASVVPLTQSFGVEWTKHLPVITQMQVSD